VRNFFDYAFKLSRGKKIALLFFVDAALLALSFMCAMLLLFESLSLKGQTAELAALLFSIMATLLAFWGFGLYRVVVRFVTGKIFVLVAKGAIVAATSLFVASHFFFDANIPWTLSIMFSVFSFLFIGGLRFAARAYFRKPNNSQKQPVIVYGAGEAGLQLVNALFHGQKFSPVSLVDDEPSLQNMIIGGLRVFSPDKIPYLVQTTGAKVILLAIPSLSRFRRQEILSELEDLQLEIKTVPGMSDIISGKAKISELRTVSAEDLLGRDPVAPDPKLLCKNITRRVVMVSGAGGSIGSELCRQILTQDPSVLVLYDLSEFALYTIEAELTETATRLQKKTKVVPILGSVQHSRRLDAAIKTFKVKTIYHAAAYKHVPLVEENMVEGILNNVFGTLSFTLSAQKHGVENFILISTDKAVRPTSVMGATKRIAELICQAHAEKASPTVFSMVRFGNVLGSSGSVIPRFSAQIKKGGPVTVTDKDINRYFMTIPEAAQLVIQAGALSHGGDVFVLDMGEPIKIYDLAKRLISLSGMELKDEDNPEGDIEIIFTGLRPGEKLYEELLIGDRVSTTEHKRILRAEEDFLVAEEIEQYINLLQEAEKKGDVKALKEILRKVVSGFTPENEIVDVLSLQKKS